MQEVSRWGVRVHGSPPLEASILPVKWEPRSKAKSDYVGGCLHGLKKGSESTK